MMFSGVCRTGFDLCAPVRISDYPVLRQFPLARSRDRLKKGAVALLDAHQVIGAIESLVEHAAAILREVVIATCFQNAITGEQAPGDKRYLLRVEIRRKILMREV